MKQGEEKARRQAIDADQLEKDANSRQGNIDRLAAAVRERSARVEVGWATVKFTEGFFP